jgi:hypothetical protein
MKFFSKFFTKEKTARRVYIEMLRQRIGAIDTLSQEEREHFLWAELIAAGHLNGVTRTNATGIPTGNVIMGPTVKGRLFLQELELSEHKESLHGKLIKVGLVAGGFVAGIASAILIEFLKKKLQLSN